MLAGLDVHPDAARLAFVAALAHGGSDTIASEIGKAFGRTTLSMTTLARVPPGTSGAMSLEGTAAGVAGALALGAVGVALGLVPLAALLRRSSSARRPARCSRAGSARRSKVRVS